jgi:hypothetical protein
MGECIPAGAIHSLVGRLDSSAFVPDVYRKTGLFVLRRAIPEALILEWQAAWAQFCGEIAAGRHVDPYNPVVVHEPLTPPLREIYRCASLLDVLETIYPDLALYTQRIVIKDGKSRGPVFLHHDAGYDIGWPDKTSVFVPLSKVSGDNGGLVFYPGTHVLGYLGDAGELNRAMIDPDWPTVCPALDPGDVVLMHECTWHESRPHVAGPDRIVVQITYQPSSDPSSVELLRGQWRTDIRLADLPRDRFFTRSRASRLRELQAEVDRVTKP